MQVSDQDRDRLRALVEGDYLAVAVSGGDLSATDSPMTAQEVSAKSANYKQRVCGLFVCAGRLARTPEGTGGDCYLAVAGSGLVGLGGVRRLAATQLKCPLRRSCSCCSAATELCFKQLGAADGLAADRSLRVHHGGDEL